MVDIAKELTVNAMINRITITGADDKVNPEDLAYLSAHFPFVEWGILSYPKKIGKPRFPTSNWIQKLTDKAESQPMNLSLHLCGDHCETIGKGKNVVGYLGFSTGPFDRIQLNGIHYYIKNKHDLSNLLLWFGEKREIIFQSPAILLAAHAASLGLNVSVLFDESGGKGKVPDKWPDQLALTKCGYAGGLSPDNIEEEIGRIVAGRNGRFDSWLDMESGVRTNNEFDLDKVTKVLESASKLLSL